MTRPIPTYLRLYTERFDAPPALPPAALEPIAQACRAFTQATGWPLIFDATAKTDAKAAWSAVVECDGLPPAGCLRLDWPANGESRAQQTSFEVARDMAASVARLVGELAKYHRVVREREAELAAGVPVVPRPDAEAHLAKRLEAVLQGGATAVECVAAALYLLDDATTELKLRAAWGLPIERLVDPPRPLRHARGDLEALCGHAVVIDDANLTPTWNMPEPFRAAVCVPVSSPMVPLGTLWVFCDHVRSFDSRQVNLIEMIAGRVAADLEREMLCAEGASTADLKRQVAAAETLAAGQLPRIAPAIAGWDIAGWTSPRGGLSCEFHDWLATGDGRLGFVVGDCLEPGIAGAMSVACLRGVCRAHARDAEGPSEWLSRVNRTLWSASCGDQMASLFVGMVDDLDGRIRYCMAGQLTAIIVRADGHVSLFVPALEVGVDAAPNYLDLESHLAPGDLLVVATDGVRDAVDAEGRRFGEAALIESLRPFPKATAAAMAELIRDRLEAFADAPREDRTLLILRRR